MADAPRLFISLYTDSGIAISSEQFSRRRFGELLRLVLRLLNTLLADEMRDCVVYLQQFKE